jgi:hypothetical protein
VVERQFTGSHFAVRRFVLHRVSSHELPFRRMECAPGQELQVDFGRGAWVMEAGKADNPLNSFLPKIFFPTTNRRIHRAFTFEERSLMRTGGGVCSHMARVPGLF